MFTSDICLENRLERRPHSLMNASLSHNPACFNKTGQLMFECLNFLEFNALEFSYEERKLVKLSKLSRLLSVKTAVDLWSKTLLPWSSSHKAMVSWFPGWRIDRCNENTSDWSKLAREKSAIQGINWPWPKYRVLLDDGSRIVIPRGNFKIIIVSFLCEKTLRSSFQFKFDTHLYSWINQHLKHDVFLQTKTF